MKLKSTLKNRLILPFVGLILVFMSIFTPVSVYAEPTTENTTPVTTETETAEITTEITPETEKNTSSTEKPEQTENTEETKSEQADQSCYDQVVGVGWLICPNTGVFAQAIDAIYGIIEDLLTVSPITTDGSSPIYIVWQYARDITNIVFIIMLLVVIWSQLTGVGINNYGIKKTLPRLIVAAVLVNLSFIICSLAVDVSNILGVALRGFFENIQNTALLNTNLSSASVSWTDLVASLTGGTGLAALGIGLTGGIGHFLWVLIGALIGGILSVFVGLITIALRQALVAMLIMISPLAFVAYLLPNTEKYFEKWKDMLFSMLIFFPMFSVLFGAAQLAGWAIVASSSSAFGVILGMAVQVMPLLLSISLLKMSNTVLGTISSKLDGLASRGAAGAKAWTGSYAEQHKQHHIANSMAPSAGLRRYLDGRRKARETDTANSVTIREGNANIYAQRKIGLGKNEAYDPGNEKQKFRTNRYTRNAKRAIIMGLDVSRAERDTKSILNSYGKFHGNTALDQQLNAQSAHSSMEYTRAELAEINDNYADIDFLMGQYDKLRQLDPNSYAYKHYFTGAAGGLEKDGELTVLGEVISKAAANERQRRSAVAYVFGKYGYSGLNKVNFRDFAAGYHVDDDGFAVTIDKAGHREKLKLPKLDKDGNKILKDGKEVLEAEPVPGYFLHNRPEELAKYSAYDKYEIVTDPTTGKERKKYYFDVVEPNGTHVSRIYKDDGPAMKEILSNFDMPIADPIDGLYAILAGVDQGKYTNQGLDGVGLGRYRTTISNNLKVYKEKAAYASAMLSALVNGSGVSNYAHLNLARMDNFIKTVKPGALNRQDSAEWAIDARIVDPANWEDMFFPDEESLRTAMTVNHMPLKGTRIKYDKNGKPIGTETVPPEQATFEDLKNTVLAKYIIPGAASLATMMTRISPAVADDLKPGVAGSRHDLVENLHDWITPENLAKYPILEAVKNSDPLHARESDAVADSRELRETLKGESTENRRTAGGKGGGIHVANLSTSEAPNLGGNGPTINRDPRLDQKELDHQYVRERTARLREQNSTENALSDPLSPFPNIRNYFAQLELIAAGHNDPELFYEDAREYLNHCAFQDDRLYSVLDDLDAQYNEYGTTYTVNQYLELLGELLDYYL